ncbi:concanavalin A-like lectin/glucanase domain-containing protein [Xylariaceae sp. FL1272]|nr:concanavalin A-like lectin/glucanase domain-containing protein [Xylariaceae sp. FL1272]
MPSLQSLLLLSTAAALAQSSPLQKRQSCDCWKASDSSTAVFSNRKFFDFRNIANPSTPAVISDQSSDANAATTNAYFSSAEWTDTWSIQSWATAGEGVARQNSKNNVFIAQNDDGSSATYLSMRTARNQGYQTTAEVESIATNYQYATLRMKARTTGASGAVTSLFTYLGDPLQEADIEIRTLEETDIINYTNQPGSTDGATDRATIPGVWTDWLEYRYDWTPGSSDWYINDQLVASIQLQTPTNPLSILMNVWSDGGVWSGVMAVGDQAAMDVQWLDVTYNTSSQAAATCSSVCSLDTEIA